MKNSKKSDAENKLKMSSLLLAGGNSSRMGKNKAFLKIGNKSIIERNLGVLEGLFEEVLISAQSCETYHDFEFRVVEDVFPGKGPLSGIYSGMQAAKFDYVFVTACDMPRLNREGILMLAEKIGDYDIVIPKVSGKLHPMHAFYHKKIQDIAFKHLKAGRLRLIDLANECKTKVVEFEEFADSLINVNTPEEWTIIEKIERLNNVEED
jgi:molybdopterin-guanine dinucleotide biosynthesis protein A